MAPRSTTHRKRVGRANRLIPDHGWFWCLESAELGPIETGIKPTRAQARIEVAYWARCFFTHEAAARKAGWEVVGTTFVNKATGAMAWADPRQPDAWANLCAEIHISN